MIRHYCEKFIEDPVGAALKNTFLLNSRVVAKILSGTPLYVTEEDLESAEGLPQEIVERLKDLNQKWLEINRSTNTRKIGMFLEEYTFLNVLCQVSYVICHIPCDT